MMKITDDLLCVVDDDESIRDSVGALLRSIGFAVTTFASAEALLGSSAVEEASCLILDVRMPGMTGPELQRQLADDGCTIPIIFITAQKTPNLKEDLLRAGAVAFLPKPFHERELLDALRDALGTLEGHGFDQDTSEEEKAP